MGRLVFESNRFEMKIFFTLLICLITAFKADAQRTRYVYFDSDKSELKPQGESTLDSLLVVLKRVGKYSLTISGYCDSTGTHEDNVPLSFERARAVYEYLKSKGVDSTVMFKKGYAEAPGNDDEESRARNRRVEIATKVGVPPKVSAPKGPPPLDVATFSKEIEVGKTFLLKNLNFIGNRAVLVPESVPMMAVLLEIMQKNPTLQIEIGGHVSCYNDTTLSKARAKFVYKYLVNKGIDSTRMTWKGYGHTKPLILDDCHSEEAGKQNRRVEIKVLKK